MDLSQLTAISPVDGRYRPQVEDCDLYFSEFALIRFRLMVEVEYFIALCEIPLPQLKEFRHDKFEKLRDLYRMFTPEEALKVKAFEKITNHDVKAVEYYLKERFEQSGFTPYKEFIHFGLTSQDVNNTAVPYSLALALKELYHPLIGKVLEKLADLASAWKSIPMLARTHGQPASPTRLGKEMLVFAERLQVQIGQLQHIPMSAKFGGATGNFNAHAVAYPDISWKSFADQFISKTFGLSRQQTTTQIEHYDNMAAVFDAMKRINTILIDLNRDMWTYISMDYFTQQIKEGEVGSSVMPHKVNPIDFENSEGNLGMANAIFEHLAAKLPVSRLQRDLTDSTVLRNIGVPFAHSLLALKSILKGLNKVMLNNKALEDDLEKNYVVLSEAIQTILRREGYANPYEALKALTRTNRRIQREDLHAFIEGLNVSENVKAELRALTPSGYTGI